MPCLTSLNVASNQIFYIDIDNINISINVDEENVDIDVFNKYMIKA
jgi:hypothetical protein